MADRFAFRIPRACAHCATDRIRLVHTIKGPLVHLSWQCSTCGLEWPIHAKDQNERRIGERRLMLRKRLPSKERRRKSA